MEASLDAKKKDKIERIIFKILYDNLMQSKSIKSTTVLVDKVLEKTLEEKITISEKNIKNIINELKDEKKIQFSQGEGWRIRI